MQGPRWSIPYFVNPKLNFVIQGPEKRWGPVTGFDLLSKTGAPDLPVVNPVLTLHAACASNQCLSRRRRQRVCGTQDRHREGVAEDCLHRGRVHCEGRRGLKCGIDGCRRNRCTAMGSY